MLLGKFILDESRTFCNNNNSNIIIISLIDVEECGIPISPDEIGGENIVTKMAQIIQIKAQKRGKLSKLC